MADLDVDVAPDARVACRATFDNGHVPFQVKFATPEAATRLVRAFAAARAAAAGSAGAGSAVAAADTSVATGPGAAAAQTGAAATDTSAAATSPAGSETAKAPSPLPPTPVRQLSSNEMDVGR